MNVGFQLVTRVINGVDTWFLFHREYAFSPAPAYCQYDFARIVVRNSTDRGLTWSDKVGEKEKEKEKERERKRERESTS